MDLYLQARDHGWKPPGVRMGRDWDVCSMEPVSAKRYLGSWAADSTVKECIAWFDAEDSARLIVADLEGGRRIIIRVLANSTKITFSRWRSDVATEVKAA